MACSGVWRLGIFAAAVWARALPAQQGSQAAPPALVEVYRDSLLGNASLDVYRSNADDAAALCRKWICPHPYLGIETVSGPPEVWFLNFFITADDTARVGRLYAEKREMSQALAQQVARNKSLVISSNVFADFEETPTAEWEPRGSRFVVVARPGSAAIEHSAWYRSRSGSSFSFAFVRTRGAADSVAHAIGTTARVFAIRQQWSQPDPAWIRADPAFWGEWPSGLPTEGP
jgi:hypothetical protein